MHHLTLLQFFICFTDFFQAVLKIWQTVLTSCKYFDWPEGYGGRHGDSLMRFFGGSGGGVLGLDLMQDYHNGW